MLFQVTYCTLSGALEILHLLLNSILLDDMKDQEACEIAKIRVFHRRLASAGIFNNRLLFKKNRLLFPYCFLDFCGEGTRLWWGDPPIPPARESPEDTVSYPRAVCCVSGKLQKYFLTLLGHVQ